MGYFVTFTHWSCMVIDIRVVWYFRMLALPGWRFECKSRETYWIRLRMMKCDIRFSQWNFKCFTRDHEQVDSSHISNIISIEFLLENRRPTWSCRITVSCAPVGQPAGLPACTGQWYSGTSLGCWLAVRSPPLTKCRVETQWHCADCYLNSIAYSKE